MDSLINATKALGIDVSSSQWADVAKQIKSLERLTDRRKGQKPETYPPAHQVISNLTSSLQKNNPEDPDDGIALPDPAPYLPCRLPMVWLKPIMITDMRFETHHRSSRLTLRVLTPPHRAPFVTTVMEDEAGVAVAIQLCREPEDFVVPSEVTIRRHRVCIIKDPFFRCSTGDIPFVQVYHVSDLIWLESSHELVPSSWREIDSNAQDKSSSNTFRQQGTAAMLSGKWAEAEHLYSAAMTTADSPNDEHLARLDRSFANLKLGRLESALEDARHRVPGAPASEMGLFWEARALYELDEFNTALAKYEELAATFPENEDVGHEMRRVRARIREQQTGEYAFLKMQEQVSAGDPFIDCATYTGPVEVRPSPGCGRGLFTTRSVKAGDLIICDKAFVYEHAGGLRARGGPVPPHGDTSRAYTTSFQGITTIVQYLAHSPASSSSQEFLKLYHGDYKPAPQKFVDGRPIVDTFLVKAIEGKNAIETVRSIRDRCLYLLAKIVATASRPAERDVEASGIWLKTSYINHDCVGNCVSAFIGDVQIIRAKQDLDAGTELRFPRQTYEPLKDSEKRQALKEKWGFQCNCALCRHDQAIPAWKLSSRRTLRDEAEKALGDKSDLTKVGQILSMLEMSHSENEPAGSRMEMWHSYWLLALIHLKEDRAAEAAEALVKTLEVQGFDVVASPPRRRADNRSLFEIRAYGMMEMNNVLILAKLSVLYKRLDPMLVGVVTNYARMVYRMIVGEDDTFEGELPKISSFLGT